MDVSGSRGRQWIIVLAAGGGNRLRTLLRAPDGTPVPKQFCVLDGSASMLQWTLGRATRLVSPSRILVVVAREHRRWWEPELADLPPGNVLVQPENRGTAVGILFPLIEVLRRDPDATVAVMPSDHHVADEPRLLESVAKACELAHREPGRTVLLGMTPSGPEPGYGWVVPGPPRGAGLLREVVIFEEKPDPAMVELLVHRGALLNSFIVAARGRTLLELCRRTLPERVARLEAAAGGDLGSIYGQLTAADFSRDVLARACGALAVLPAPECGWSDLGTPERLARYRGLGHGEVA